MTVVVLGEALIDLVEAPDGCYVAHPGGSPANTAVALARLGTPVAFAGRLSGDGFGRRLRAHLEANGVDIGLSVAAAEPTTLAVVELDARGGAGYTFYVEGTTTATWAASDLPACLPEQVNAIHTGSVALALPSGGEVISGLLRREHGRRAISLDPNVRHPFAGDRETYRHRLEGWLRCASLVKVSLEDLQWVYPGGAVTEIGRRWRGLGPALVVVTLGAAGCMAFVGDEEVTRAATPVTLVDTIGAGDSFAAGLLDWLDRHERLGAAGPAALTVPETLAALDFASRVASITVSRAGADPPFRRELRD
ncbi:MAG: fructokinase [Chloroflexota bacterium]|nr:fructokinase [Chloroflexota bacterium]